MNVDEKNRRYRLLLDGIEEAKRHLDRGDRAAADRAIANIIQKNRTVCPTPPSPSINNK